MKKDNNIYMDYNATSALKPEVKEAMVCVLGQTLNPSSVHGAGREAKRLMEMAREKVRKLVNGGNSRVIFTASGTEANNLAITGLNVDACFVSAVEHPSILRVAERIGARTIPVTPTGIVDLIALDTMLQNVAGRKLVSVMLANNEIGVIQPIKDVAKVVYKHGGYLHCDAAQAVGKIKVDMQDLNVDMLTVSAHKFGGPQGAAALIVKAGLDIAPQIFGGGQESGKRAGTENVAAIVGFGVAAELADENIGKFVAVKELRNWIEQAIKEEGKVIGDIENRLPNTISLYMPGMKAETQVINFDLERIAVSAGSACSSGKVEKSHVLKAMGFDKEILENTIRVSLTPNTTKNEAEKFVRVWKELYQRANKQAEKKAA